MEKSKFVFKKKGKKNQKNPWLQRVFVLATNVSTLVANLMISLAGYLQKTAITYEYIKLSPL